MPATVHRSPPAALPAVQYLVDAARLDEMAEQRPLPADIEGVLVFGGALLFGWWQLRSVVQGQRTR